jgi:hypothetical protein
MNLISLAIAIASIAVALVSLRTALADRKKLAAITADHHEHTRKTERSLQELSARSDEVEQQTTDDLAHLRSDLATRLDAGLAQVQDALAEEVAAQVAPLRDPERS